MDGCIHITTPLCDDVVCKLKAGDQVRITGKIYTARDAAHKRISSMIEHGEQLPFDMSGQVIYYTGPCPPRPGAVTGSAGPTTSGRMDKYTPLLLDNGLKGMIGKGDRDGSVVDAIKRNKAVYFAAAGGLGALISKKIVSMKEIAFEDLGTESIKEIWVEDFPCIVAIDCSGNDQYKIGREKYERRNQDG